jgi:hypothetical protein
MPPSSNPTEPSTTPRPNGGNAAQNWKNLRPDQDRGPGSRACPAERQPDTACRPSLFPCIGFHRPPSPRSRCLRPSAPGSGRAAHSDHGRPSPGSGTAGRQLAGRRSGPHRPRSPLAGSWSGPDPRPASWGRHPIGPPRTRRTDSPGSSGSLEQPVWSPGCPTTAVRHTSDTARYGRRPLGGTTHSMGVVTATNQSRSSNHHRSRGRRRAEIGDTSPNFGVAPSAVYPYLQS